MTKRAARTIEGFISESDFARRVGLTVFGIRRWRARGYGPVPVKLGRAVFYRAADVGEFLASLEAAT